jgi:hypothetical protein
VPPYLWVNVIEHRRHNRMHGGGERAKLQRASSLASYLTRDLAIEEPGYERWRRRLQ